MTWKASWTKATKRPVTRSAICRPRHSHKASAIHNAVFLSVTFTQPDYSALGPRICTVISMRWPYIGRLQCVTNCLRPCLCMLPARGYCAVTVGSSVCFECVTMMATPVSNPHLLVVPLPLDIACSSSDRIVGPSRGVLTSSVTYACNELISPEPRLLL